MDYSINDGRVRSLIFFGEVLVNEDGEKPGWREKLWEWAEGCGMHVEGRHGWRAWVIRLAEELGKELPSKQ